MPSESPSDPFHLHLISKLALLFVLAFSCDARAASERAAQSGEGLVGVLSELIETGQYDDAEELVEELAEDGPLSVEVALLEARRLREIGRGSESLSMLKARPEYESKDARVRAMCGDFLSATGQHESAIDEYTTALESDSRSVIARVGLARSRIRLGKRSDAEPELSQVLEQYRSLSTAQARATSAEEFVAYGEACELLNRYSEAYSVMYSSALDLDESNVGAHIASGHALLAKYNYPDARSHFEDALKRNPNSAEAHIGLAMSTYVDFQYPRNRFGDTERHLRLAERTWPNHPDGLVLRGHLVFYAENWSEAERLYRAAVAQDPTSPIYQGHVATVLYAAYRLPEFRALCDEIEANHPTPAPFFATIAERLVERFFYEESANYARKAVELDPDYWPAYVTLGINALRVGRDEEGREYVAKAFENDRFNVWASNTLKLIEHIDSNFIETRTEDFVYRFLNDDDAAMRPYLDELMLEKKKRFERDFEVTLSKPIYFESFSRHAFFSARSIGLPGLAAAGVCFGKLVTLTTPRAIPGNWGAVAVHEFSHVVALQKTGQRVPRWFTEGLSTFEEGRTNPNWVRYMPEQFANATTYRTFLPIERLQEGFTKPDGPGRILLSYYQGKVICEWIHNRWGLDKLVGMLESFGTGKNTVEAIEEVLDMTPAQFNTAFYEYCDAQVAAHGLAAAVPEARIDALRLEIEDHPTDLARRVELGLGYYFQNRLDDAELVIGKARKLGESSDLFALEGFVNFARRRERSATRKLERAIELGTKYQYRAHVALALLIRDDEPDRAIDLLEKAIALHPMGITPRYGAPNPYYTLANLYVDAGREKDGIAVMKRLIPYAREDLGARMQVARYHAERDEWREVLDWLRDGVYINPFDTALHAQLGRAEFEMKSWRLAKRSFQIQLLGEDADARSILPRLAMCELELGDREAAKKYAERGLRIDPGSAIAKEVLERLK